MALGLSSLALVTAVPAATAAAPQWQSIEATSAEAFIDSMGVNVHTSYTDTVYADQERTLRLVQELGVRHVRDGVKHDNLPSHRGLQLLRDNGIRASLIVDPAGRQGSGTLAQQIDALKDPDKLGGVADVLEGPNELDCSGDGWLERVTSQQDALAAAVDAEPALRDLPLLGPSWCEYGSIQKYGADGDSSDAVNVHAYTGSRKPEYNAGTYAHTREINPGKPLYVTEIGYHNAVNGDGWGHVPTSEKASAPYTVRTFLYSHMAGIERTYIYELQNQHDETELVDREMHFGLVRNDGTRRPAFTAVKNTISTLADPGPRPADRTIQVGYNAPDDLVSVAFARRDGSTDLVLWRDASVWDRDKKQDITVPTSSMTVSTRQSASGSVVSPVRSAERTPLGSGSSFTLEVGADPVILRLAPGGSAGTPSPSPTPSDTTPVPSPPASPTPGATTPASPTTPASMPVGTALRLDVGSSSGGSSGGWSWQPDSGFTGGTVGTARQAVAGTKFPETYRTYRWGMSSYETSVPDGDYRVSLMMAEDAFGAAGRRVFTVTAEGEPALADMDLFATAGMHRAVWRSFTFSVDDGTLDLGFDAAVDNAVVAGMEITRLS